MTPLKYLCFRKILLLLLCSILFSCSSFFVTFASSDTSVDGELQQTQFLDPHFRVRRLLVKDLEIGDSDEETNPPPRKKKKLNDSVSSSTSGTKKNQTKLTDSVPSTSGTKKNQTKLTKPISSSSSSSSSTKNQTKLAKTTTSPKLNSTKSSSNTTKTGSDLKKLKSSNSTSSTKKPTDLSKSKNKTTTKLSPPPPEKKKTPPSSSKPATKPKPKPAEKAIKPFWLDDEEDEDFISEFRDLPTRFQRTLIPDLEKISTTSKSYINKANKEITKNFKPYFGNKYSPTIASVVSFVFIS